MCPPSNFFRDYAWFSVQVDQYYSATRIFARHHDALRATYAQLPKGDDWPEDFSGIPEKSQGFFIQAASSLNYMGTTGIFSDAPYPELNNLSVDVINFGFYTCYCFQWTLFENFVKGRILGLTQESLLTSEICDEIRNRKRQTARFLKYIDSGAVFGHSPFFAILPTAGWVPKTEECDFADLTEIREQRNRFVHAVKDPSILPNTEIEKERSYERSMWVLRQFASNLDQRVERLRSAVPAQEHLDQSPTRAEPENDK